ncbi:nitroreductase [Wenyingzhuangia heitensis]|uniref:Nitroreductase n=1 Tax=Wenyingzhuangia heitensis TaxID=1487859 RepID=A0ABX0U8R9_9FLAO|nr:nitroreductase family protein [Wenyingzhuangia heitensis]NIJ44598.1 nitroreductase [Wenyingzhuangia heitensis]
MSLFKNILLKRRTLKILSDTPLEITLSEELNKDIEEMITLAGKAPFHYPANASSLKNHTLKSLAPWRFYILNTKACRDLAKYYTDNNIEGGKIIQMLHSATALIQATWIPEPSENKELEFNQKNIEHIAATSAAIQNLLLAATEKEFENYWSSGGTLRNDDFKKLLHIPTSEQLLGSIFLFKDINTENTKQVTGAWRNKQGENKDYSSFINI